MVCETQLYDLLMVPVTATVDQIAKSYKKLALKYHPDKTNHNPECTEKFKDLSRAYEILKDPHQREIYDAYGAKGLDGSLAEETGQSAPGGFNPNCQSRNPGFGFEQAVFSQLFNDMTSAFGPGVGFPPSFSQPFGEAPLGQSFSYGMNFSLAGPSINTGSPSRIVRPDMSRKRHSKPQKGASIHHNFKVTLADMYHGKEAKFSVPKMTKCSSCQGMGSSNPKICNKCEGTGRLIISVSNQFAQFEERRDCDCCSGTGIYSRPEDMCTRCDKGYKMESKILKVSIPPGSKNGDKCILLGQADEGKDIIPGDIIIHLHEETHPFLIRRQNDLYMEQDIDLKTALLGGKLIISDFPRTGEDVILYINVHGRKRLNDSVHPLINTGEVIGTINSGVPKIVKGLGMPINDSIKNGKFYQTTASHMDEDITSYKRGDLYIKFNVQLPEITDFAGEDDLQLLQRILPDKSTKESFGTVAWEHNLSNIPGMESVTVPTEEKILSTDDNASADDHASSDGYDYEQLDVDSQDGSEEQEDNHFYAQEWSKEREGKRRKVEI
ncbi:hypothetical protein JCM33374_g2837 [Metschnikowia sp. JCM 33374]|nr:hypothetical protein JCM33374_g2837 [Metschnikowia sp. JCM 33374]